MTGSLGEIRRPRLEGGDACRLAGLQACRLGNWSAGVKLLDTQASIGDGGSEIGFQATAGVFPTVAAPDMMIQDRAPLKNFLPRLVRIANPIFEKPYCPWEVEVISIARGFPGSVQPVVSCNSGVVDIS